MYMYATAATSLVNWFRVGRPLLQCRGCRKLGFGGAQNLFTATNHGCNDNVEHQNQWRLRYTNCNAADCCTSPFSAIHLLVVAPIPPALNQRRKFYAVRKGQIPGIYHTWGECKQQVQGFSGNKHKGFSSRKEAENYLHAHGMKSVTPCLDVEDSRIDLHEAKPACLSETLLEAVSSAEGHLENSAKSKRARKKAKEPEENLKNSPKFKQTRKKPDVADPVILSDDKFICEKSTIPEEIGSADLLKVSTQLEECIDKPSNSRRSRKKLKAADANEALYQLEFDGASKGNPGKAGAGAVLRNQDGSVVCKLREGVGVATNNVAEYRAVILGLKVALSKGITRIQVQGDSKLVCMQIQDLWKTKNENIVGLSKEAKELKSKFKSFQIIHVERAFNSEADALANAAIKLQND